MPCPGRWALLELGCSGRTCFRGLGGMDGRSVAFRTWGRVRGVPPHALLLVSFRCSWTLLLSKLTRPAAVTGPTPCLSEYQRGRWEGDSLVCCGRASSETAAVSAAPSGLSRGGHEASLVNNQIINHQQTGLSFLQTFWGGAGVLQHATVWPAGGHFLVTRCDGPPPTLHLTCRKPEAPRGRDAPT